MALDPHSAQVSLLLHCDGADGSATFVDSGARPKAITVSGAVSITTARSKFGGAAATFENGGYLAAGAHVDFAFGNDAFAVEVWVRTVKQTSFLVDCAGSWTLNLYQGAVYWDSSGDGSGVDMEGTRPVADGQWHHIAITSALGVHRIFVDGVMDGEYPVPKNYAAAGDVVIGGPASYGHTNYYFVGDLDELRITKGVARYTSSFTPPTEPSQIPEAAAGVVTASASAPAMLGQPRVLANLPKSMVWVSADSPLGVSGPSVLAVRVEYGVFSPASLQPVRFGGALLLAEMPPALTAFQAASLVAGRFGVPSCASRLQAGDVQSTRPVRFGVPRATFSAAAQSIASTNFGAPALSAASPAGSLRTSRFGVPRLTCALGAQHVRGVRFGVPSLNLPSVLFGVSSLAPVRMGEPYLRGVALRARALCGTHFGTPSLERGPLC